METSTTVEALGLQGVGALYSTMLKTYASGGVEALMREHGLVIAMVALALVVLALLAVVVFMPSRRKVTVRRRVRVTRQAVAAEPARQEAEDAGEVAEEPAAAQAPAPWWQAWIVPVVAGVIVLAAFIGTYVVTGSNGYCGQSCHVENPRVVTAVENNHGDCIDCHESGPVSGGVARLRMAVGYLASDEPTITSVPVDPRRCLSCHGNVETETITGPAGLRVSHKEILASGRTCSDCHRDVGHRVGRSFQGGMSSCTVCHDGVTAASECEVCHADGSPLEVVRTVGSSAASFPYSPVQVANRDCSRCHGSEEKCVDCHNGFVLPHPKEFLDGGHGRIAAFEGKNRCFKCHTIAWCGSGKCHHAFSPHDAGRWPTEHQTGTSKLCGSCHIAWDGEGNWCDVCH